MPEADNRHQGDPFQYWGFIGNEYVDEGVDPIVRLLTAEAAGVEQKFRHLFNFNKDQIKQRVIVPHLINEMKAKGLIETTDEMGNELLESQIIERHMERLKQAELLCPGTLRKWENIVESTYSLAYRLIVKEPLLSESYLRMRDNLVGGSIARSRLISGKKRDDEDKRFNEFDSLIREVTTCNESSSPYTYLAGNPGSGKSNGLGTLIGAAWKQKNWVYTNLPVESDRTHRVYTISRLSDLFTDTKEKPSLIRMRIIGEQDGIEIGAMLVADERGKALSSADRSTTTVGRMQMAFDQLRRHFLIAPIQAGVKQKDPKQEEFVNYLITTVADPVNAYDEFGERKYKYSWIVDKRISDTTWKRQIYSDPPKSEIAIRFKSKIKLTPLYRIDINIEEMEKTIGGFDQPLDDLCEACDNYAREVQEDET